MAARSIASLTVSFGLVSIPVKLYSATESSAAIRFRLMSPGGARVRQQYVTDTAPSRAADEPEIDTQAAEPETPPEHEEEPQSSRRREVEPELAGRGALEVGEARSRAARPQARSCSLREFP